MINSAFKAAYSWKL